ncbi:MAG TPA: hypothetical protein VMV81_13200 [Phycisphaerae bacterium]|nr:hypothetical protein [Phycisphaerae bacterium]
MRAGHRLPVDACKRSILSAFIVAAATVVGLEAARPTHAAGRKAISQVAVAGIANPGLGGLMAVTGASVLVMAWLHRESLRRPILIRRPTIYRPAGPQVLTRVERRAAAISYQSGGLYGPKL